MHRRKIPDDTTHAVALETTHHLVFGAIHTLGGHLELVAGCEISGVTIGRTDLVETYVRSYASDPGANLIATVEARERSVHAKESFLGSLVDVLAFA